MIFKYKLGVIGFGNMATAIIKGILKLKKLSPSTIAVCDTNLDKKQEANNLSLDFYSSACDLVDCCEYVLFAIKPQGFDNLAQVISNRFNDSQKIISIMAGITINRFKNYFPNNRVLRVMPNTPALVGNGISALAIDDCNNDMIKFGEELFYCVGNVILIKETDINNVIAVSGSGPAYVYEFMSAMYNKALSLGFSQEVSKLLVTQTVIGSAKMFVNSIDSLSKLCENVCSKGGTTIEAVNYLNNNSFEKLIGDAMQACLDKAIELSK